MIYYERTVSQGSADAAPPQITAIKDAAASADLGIIRGHYPLLRIMPRLYFSLMLSKAARRLFRLTLRHASVCLISAPAAFKIFGFHL